MSNDKPIPTWLPEEEIYLHSIQNSCETLSKLYLEKYKQCKSLQTKLKLPAIIIGSFTGIASFGTETFPKHLQKYVSISVGVITISIAILNTIESYLKVGENTSSSISAATALQKLREDINKELCIPTPDRVDNGIVFLRDVFTRYLQILNQAPVLDTQDTMIFLNSHVSTKIKKMLKKTDFASESPSRSLSKMILPDDIDDPLHFGSSKTITNQMNDIYSFPRHLPSLRDDTKATIHENKSKKEERQFDSNDLDIQHDIDDIDSKSKKECIDNV